MNTGERADVAVTTGEEDEETKYSLRTKLYSMEPDGGWKERGVGVLRLNVRKEDGKGARLGMSRIICYYSGRIDRATMYGRRGIKTMAGRSTDWRPS